MNLLSNNENLSLIEKTNLILKTAGLNASIISIAQLKFASPVIFVKFYEIFYGYQLDGINYSPTNRYEHSQNIDIVIYALKRQFDTTLLNDINGNLVVSGDLRSIEIIIDLYYEITLKIISQRELSLKNNNNNNNNNNSKITTTTNITNTNATINNVNNVNNVNIVNQEPKQSKIKVSSRVIYKTNSQDQVSGELKYILDRVNTLEEKMHSNLLVSSEPSLEILEPQTITQSSKPQSNSNRPNSAPPGGRKKQNNTTSQTHMILQGSHSSNDNDNDNIPIIKKNRSSSPSFIRNDDDDDDNIIDDDNDVDGNDDDNDNDNHVERKKKLKKKKSKLKNKKNKPKQSEITPAISQTEKQSTKNTPIISQRSQSMPTRPSSAPNKRSNNNKSPNSYSTDQHETFRKIIPINYNQLKAPDGTYYTYNWQSGRQELVQNNRMNREMTFQDLKEEREKERQRLIREERKKQMKPLVPTVSEYPGYSTEKSVLDYINKMNSLRNITSTNATSSNTTRTTKSSNNSSHILAPRELSIYQYLTNMDMLITVEHCCDCESHPMTLRHQSAEYISHAEEVLKHITFIIHSLRPCIRLGVLRFPIKISSKKSSENIYSRVGALEVQVSYRNQKGEKLETELIYSKLMTRRWPSKTAIEKKIISLISKYGIQTITDENSYDSRGEEGISSYPIGIGPWNEVPLSDSLWKYIPPSPENKQPINSIQWCFDSRNYAFYPKFNKGNNIKILSCPNIWDGIENYSCIGKIINIFKHPITHDNMITVNLQSFNYEVTVKESMCISLIENDDYLPPENFECIKNNIPTILYHLINYGIENDLIRWEVLSIDDEVKLYANQPTLYLSYTSFCRSIAELAWQGIHASPGEKSGTMILPNIQNDIDIQLAYSPPIIEHILKMYPNKKVNITHFLKLIRENLSNDQIKKLCKGNPISETTIVQNQQEENKVSTQTQLPTSISSNSTNINQIKSQNNDNNDMNKRKEDIQLIDVENINHSTNDHDKDNNNNNKDNNNSTIISTPNPNPIPLLEKLPLNQQIELSSQSQNIENNSNELIVSGSEDKLYEDDFDNVPNIHDNIQLILSFILIEISYSNLPNVNFNSLKLELNYKENLQSCSAGFNKLENNNQKGKHVISDIDFIPLSFQKKDIINDNDGLVSVILKLQNNIIGKGEFFLNETLHSAMNITQLISVSIDYLDGKFDISFHCCLREMKSPLSIFRVKSQKSSTFERSLSQDFPEEMELYPDDYENHDDHPHTTSITLGQSFDNHIEQIVASELPKNNIKINSEESYVINLQSINLIELINVELFGDNDLFCIIQFGNSWTYKTTVKDDAGNNAEWNFTPDMKELFFVSDGDTISSTSLTIEVYDHNKSRSHTIIGKVSLNMKDLLENFNEQNIKLLNSKNKNTGMIKLKFIVEKNEQLNSMIHNNENISITFESLKFTQQEVNNKKINYYAVFSLEFWERITHIVSKINGGYYWENLSINEKFSTKLLTQNLLSIKIYSEKGSNNGNMNTNSNNEDILFGKAEINLTQLLSSTDLINNIAVDTYDSNNIENGRLILTLKLHSKNVISSTKTSPRENIPLLLSSSSQNEIIKNNEEKEKELNLQPLLQMNSEKVLLLEVFDLTGGNSSWLDTSLWNPDTEISEWLNVELDNNNENNNLQHVISLRLGSNGLTGFLPKQLFQLQYLTELQLDGNNLEGEIPSSIGQLSLLRVLYLNNNKLTGSIPTTIGNCINLEEIDFENNLLTGLIPDEIALPKLSLLNLKRNNFNISSPIPIKLVDCKKLTLFFSDMIPYDDSDSMNKSFDWISVHNQSYYTPLLVSPRENNIQKQKNLNDISKHLLQFSQEILSTDDPFNDWNEKIHVNNWSGVKLNSINQITSLILTNVSLTGSIPICIELLQNILFLDLSNNTLEGFIPSELYRLHSLQYLYLSNNNLEGEISNEIGLLSELKSLYLNNNQLSGNIPSQLNQLTKLKRLNLSENQFEGNLAEDFFHFENLYELNLSSNNFTGTLPEFFDIPIIEILNLSKNQFDGIIPDSLCNLLCLKTFDISFTDVSGDLPRNMDKLINLEQIGLQMTKLNIDEKDIGKAKSQLVKRLPSLSHISL